MQEPNVPSVTRPIRYDFTPDEVHKLSIQLAQKTKELNSVEEEKKAIGSQYTARLNEVKATCNKLSNQVSDGYEIRNVDCDVEFHVPTEGMKTLTRKDNGQNIEEKMQQYDWNLFNQPIDDDEEINNAGESGDMLEDLKDDLRGKKPGRKKKEE